MSESVSRLHSLWGERRGRAMPAGEISPVRWLRVQPIARWLVNSLDPSFVGILLAVAFVPGAASGEADDRSAAVAIVAMLGALALTVGHWFDDRAARVVVVLGEDHLAARVIEAVRSSRASILAPVGRSVEVRSVANWPEAIQTVGAARRGELVFTGSEPMPSLQLVDATGRRAPVRIGVDVVQQRLGVVPLDLVGQDRWFCQLGNVRPLPSVHAALKRVFDIVGAVCLGLVVVFLMPLIALAIRMDSTGPVFYSQIRIGLGGRPFRIYKFRSMCQDAERSGVAWAQPGDSRVTRVGRIMRLTRIDELPQLWNVLRGEMTLVGPRPERPEYTGMLEQEVPYYAKRHSIKPGLTGWAQVRFRYTSSIQDTARALEYDLYYLKYASLALDFRIMLETVRVVLRKAGC